MNQMFSFSSVIDQSSNSNNLSNIVATKNEFGIAKMTINEEIQVKLFYNISRIYEKGMGNKLGDMEMERCY